MPVPEPAGGGVPPGGVAPGEKPGAGGTPDEPTRPGCPEGTEEWREESRSPAFAVRPRGARARVTIHNAPGAARDFDGMVGSTRTAKGRSTHGTVSFWVEFEVLEGLTPNALAEMFLGVDEAVQGDAARIRRTVVGIDVELPREEIVLACERRWVCADGAWQAMPEMRSSEVSRRPLQAVKQSRMFAPHVPNKAAGIADVFAAAATDRAVLETNEAAADQWRAACR
ncbi:MAG: hypothetical protein HY658_02170 [Actinobacteria bacterium]|nr:hypothetical protein [Actinomycetota bacterium]